MPRPSLTIPLLVAGFWLIAAAPALWAGHAALDTDSAMRLAEVRDLLHGQDWFDTAQHRMNAPFGLPMHWSRLVDAPIAALTLLSGSENFALTAWPLIVLFAVLAALARIGNRLGGPPAAITALMLGLTAAQLDGLFAPGAIDHHNVQLALMLWMLAFLMEARPRAAAAAVALSLAVGMETLPYSVVAIGAAALWLRREPAQARAFGFTLAIAAMLLQFTAVAARFRFAPACDTYSAFHAVLLAAGGTGLGAISFLPRHRLAACAALAAALLAMAALLDPACLAGPYGEVNPALRPVWLSRVSETKSALRLAAAAPSEFFAAYLYACFALAACFFSPARNRLLLALAAMALLVASFQVRAISFATFFALPGLAAVLARLPLVPLAFGLLLGSDVGFALAGDLIEGPRVASRHDRFLRQIACADERAMAPLKALPPGRVAAFVDQGPAILVYTSHSVIAGPYHRDAAGILDTYAIFAGADPRAVLKARGIAYVMTCSASPDWDFYRGKGGLIARIAAHRTPQWLVPAGRAGDVTVWRVANS